MQTARFQFGLIAALAFGLGLSLSSSEAEGYPAGSAVSHGSNPVWNVAGNFSGSGDHAVFTSDAGHAIITDVVISTTDQYNADVNMTLDDGTSIGRFLTNGYSTSYSWSATPMRHTFSSGLVVPEGSSVRLSTSRGTVYYTLSGYYAQP